MLAFRRREISPPGVGLPRPDRIVAMTAILINVAMANLDSAIANTALPTIARDLDITNSQSIWIVSAYHVTMVASLLPAASLGEVIGLRRVSLAGLVLFTIASLICGIAPSLEWLVIGRLLQGVSAASILGLSIAMTRAIYPRELIGSGLGINALVVALSLVAGPTVASLILHVTSWHWLFLINVPLGLLGIAMSLHSLPPTPRAPWRFDAVGALLCMTGLGAAVYLLNSLARSPNWLVALPGITMAALALLLLFHRQKDSPAPMLAVDLLRRPLFALSALASFLTVTIQALALVSLPFLMQDLLGYSQVETGFLITPWPVFVAAVAPFAGRWSDRIPAPALGATGMAVLCLGLALLATQPAHSTPIDIAWRMALCGVGYGLFHSPNMRTLVMSSPVERSGGAGGISGVVSNLGHATGAGIVAAVFTAFSSGGVSLALWIGTCLAMLSSSVCLVQLFTLLKMRRS